MAEFEEELRKAFLELRKEKERKFDQTVELIINLQKFDVKKTPLNTFVQVPHQVKEKKVCGFLEIKNNKIDTIVGSEFKNYSDIKEIKKLVKKYDFFIAQASLMPKVASTFGRALGPSGKMPSPQLGILMNAGEKDVQEVLEKVNKSVKIRAKEPSLKISVGKQSMKDDELIENILSVYNSVVKILPRDKENVKNFEVKFTMTKPIKIKIR